MILALLLIPTLAGTASFLIRADWPRRGLLVAAAAAHAALTAVSWGRPRSLDSTDWLALGPAALWFLSLTSLLFLVASVYAAGYLAREAAPEDGPAARPRAWRLPVRTPEAVFTGCLLFFLASMTLVILSQHVGLLWVAVEATTLVSAPLIYFHRHPHSLEATWKYLLICSVGIALALLGNFFLAIAASFQGPQPLPLTVTELVGRADRLHPVWLRAAFVLFLVGYGTKMGLVPLHTWLPDAHSEAPSPASALLSGALLNCAFLALLRLSSILRAAGQGDFSGSLLVGFGLLSLLAAAAFLIRQADYKRLLAYSSVEHMGLLALGAGLGGLGGTAALMHAVNHTLSKGLLFLAAGNILMVYGSKRTDQVRGLLRRLPLTGVLWLAGLLAITGTPPFGTFLSKLLILKGALDAGRYAVAGTALFALAAAFAAMSSIALPMVYGRGPSSVGAALRREPEPLWSVLPLGILGLLALITMFYLPRPVADLLAQAAAQLGVGP